MPDLRKTKRGWESEYPMGFRLKAPISDVKEFGDALWEYLKRNKPPFKVLKAYGEYSDERADSQFRNYYNEAALILEVKHRSLLSYLNPFYNELKSDRTVVIEWEKDKDYFRTYQEVKNVDFHATFIWKLPLEDLHGYFELLERFANSDEVYRLLLRCSEKDSK